MPEIMPEMDFDEDTFLMTSPSSSRTRTRTTSLLNKPPVSRLQLLQARFQRKLLLEKEEKMMRMYDQQQQQQQPDFGGSRNRPGAGGNGNSNGGGGAVRQFFAQRRQHNTPAAIDPLGSSNGLISLQQSNVAGFSLASRVHGNASNNNNNSNNTGGQQQQHHNSKNGSPVGWDKSYPLSPLDRDSSSSSSGYDSFNSTTAASPYKNGNGNGYGGGHQQRNDNNNNNNNHRIGGRGPGPGLAQVPSRRNLVPPVAAARRAPSLDRRPVRNGYDGGGGGGAGGYSFGNGGMRRSTSQVLVNNGRDYYDDGDGDGGGDIDEGFVPFSRTRNPRQQQNKVDVSKAYPPTTVRKSRASNQQPVNGTYKVQPRARDQLGDDPNPRGRRPVVPDIGYVMPPKVKGAQPGPTKKTSPASQPPRGPVGRTASAAYPNLVPCHLCGRSFAPDRVEKHEIICEKSNSKKRKVFDPTKMRIKGTELEEFYRQSAKGSGRNKAVEAPEPKKSDWRQKRNNFIEALRQAKVVQRHLAAGGRASDLPPPPPMDTSDYVQCPHCGRKFSESAADRHIPKCKNIKSNKNSDVRR